MTIIGGTAEMERRLRERHGWRTCPARPAPSASSPTRRPSRACVDFVLAHPARYVFLACGAPQSELLGLRITERGGAVGTGLCIGASLLFATGLEARAPAAMQRAGLEWLHRLLLQPRRMSQRLVHSQLPLLWLAARHRRRRRLRAARRSWPAWRRCRSPTCGTIAGPARCWCWRRMPDDESLGCGGLIAQAAAAGSSCASPS